MLGFSLYKTHRDHDSRSGEASYPQIHAACAKVAHLSGAAEYINVEKMLARLDELEDLRVLSKDGTSVQAPEYALLPWS